jgi:TrmH RNA methyltransferase
MRTLRIQAIVATSLKSSSMTNRSSRGHKGTSSNRPESKRAPASESLFPETFEGTGRRRTPESRIAGDQAVRAVFARDSGRVLRLFYTENKAHDVGRYCRDLAQRRLPYRMVPEDELEKIYGSPHHGGVVAITIPKPVLPLTHQNLAHLKSLGPLHFVLDGIGNPHNIGAIARSLAFFGYKSLILSDDPRQAGLSDAAYRVAEGGLEVLELYRTKGLQELIELARQDFRITGTSLSSQAQPLESLAKSSTPRLILLGNEEEGLSPQRLKTCDDLLMVPGSGVLQSLNVAQTAAVLAYALKPVSAALKSPRDLGHGHRPTPLKAGRMGEGLRLKESASTPKAPAPKAASRKKPRSPKDLRPGTKNPSR